MSQITEITLKLAPLDKPLVSKGKKVNIGDPLVKSFTEEIDEINIPKFFKIKLKNFEKYLKVKIGVHVKTGDIIAYNKRLFKKTILKSPQNGILVMVNKDAGIIGIKRQIEAPDSLVSWFNGEVTKIEDDKIIIKVDGLIIPGKDGKGKMIKGKLKVIKSPISIYDLPTDLKSVILALKTAHADIIAKADALGALAIVAEKLDQPSFKLPYLLIDKIDDIITWHDHEVVIFGDEKQFLVLNKQNLTILKK